MNHLLSITKGDLGIAEILEFKRVEDGHVIAQCTATFLRLLLSPGCRKVPFLSRKVVVATSDALMH